MMKTGRPRRAYLEIIVRGFGYNPRSGNQEYFLGDEAITGHK